MLKPYLKSGTPAICLITPEPDRGEKIIQCEEWDFFAWDCLRGIRKAGTNQIINEVQIQLRRLSGSHAENGFHKLHKSPWHSAPAEYYGVLEFGSTSCFHTTLDRKPAPQFVRFHGIPWCK